MAGHSGLGGADGRGNGGRLGTSRRSEGSLERKVASRAAGGARLAVSSVLLSESVPGAQCSCRVRSTPACTQAAQLAIGGHANAAPGPGK